jgi:hypothetical protein
MHGGSDSPKAVPLAQPRVLTAQERALVNWFVEGPVGRPELRAQAGAALVVATCSCGCPSVYLEVPSEVAPARLDGSDPDVRHGQDASFTPGRRARMGGRSM